MIEWTRNGNGTHCSLHTFQTRRFCSFLMMVSSEIAENPPLPNALFSWLICHCLSSSHRNLINHRISRCRAVLPFMVTIYMIHVIALARYNSHITGGQPFQLTFNYYKNCIPHVDIHNTHFAKQEKNKPHISINFESWLLSGGCHSPCQFIDSSCCNTNGHDTQHKYIMWTYIV